MVFFRVLGTVDRVRAGVEQMQSRPHNLAPDRPCKGWFRPLRQPFNARLWVIHSPVGSKSAPHPCPDKFHQSMIRAFKHVRRRPVQQMYLSAAFMAVVLLILTLDVESNVTSFITRHVKGQRTSQSNLCNTIPVEFGLEHRCTRPYLDVYTSPAQLSNCPESKESKPLVAHCVSGLSRTFVELLVFKSLKHNLIDAFGGRVVLFLLLKTFDVAPKKQNQIPSTYAEDLVEVDLNAQWLRAMKAALDWVKPQHVKLIKSQHTEFNSECMFNNVSYEDGIGAYNTEAGAIRHIGQMQASMDCLETISEYERSNGVSFDIVSRSRPDLGYLAPFEPYCSKKFASLRNDTVFSSSKDYFYIMNRKMANRTLSVLDEYRACRGISWWQGEYETLLRHVSGGKGDFALDHAPKQDGGAFLEAGFPIGLVRGEHCDIDGSCNEVAGLKVQCANELACLECLGADCRGKHSAECSSKNVVDGVFCC